SPRHGFNSLPTPLTHNRILKWVNRFIGRNKPHNQSGHSTTTTSSHSSSSLAPSPTPSPHPPPVTLPVYLLPSAHTHAPDATPPHQNGYFQASATSTPDRVHLTRPLSILLPPTQNGHEHEYMILRDAAAYSPEKKPARNLFARAISLYGTLRRGKRA